MSAVGSTSTNSGGGGGSSSVGGGAPTGGGSGGIVASSSGSGGSLASSGVTTSSGGGPTFPHTWDLASSMPSRLAVMFSMSWFGIPASDPQGAGPDPSYGNAKWGGGCVTADNPASCGTCVLLGEGNACQQTGAAQRSMASRRRMLAGIYSASAQDPEGLKRVDLMLSHLRRPCDDGAKLDTWAVQLNGTLNTPLHPANTQAASSGLSYHALEAFFDEADHASLTNAVMPADDSTFYFHFGSNVGLGACNDSPGNPRQSCIDALTQDFVDMSTMSASHPSALRINDKPVLFTYFDPAHLDPAEWNAILENARSRSGRDFYVVGAIQNPGLAGYFAAFDALSPWVQLNWNVYSGATVREHAFNWAKGMHAALAGARPAYPGRVLFGAMTPGFDDYTMNWGSCKERQLPPGDPRNPDVLLGEFDYFRASGTTALIGQTWDDWTEGTEFEPDVAGGASVLISMRDQLGQLYGDAPDAAGDQRLIDRWNSYGQARNCGGGGAASPPATDLGCATAPSCGDDICNGAETCTSCAADCGACPPVCGDGTCSGTETCSGCPSDCGQCPQLCGDGVCNGAETCTNCADDCGQCPLICGDGVCSTSETCSDCPDDCGACPPVCGDGACNGAETCSTCDADCGACPAGCGDGACDGTETCNSCDVDCGPCPPACGDGACNGTETCTSCATDCGECAPLCGDGACNGLETCLTCAPDCSACPGACGDGICDPVETCDGCPADCGVCP